MARARMIKPEFWSDEKIGELTHMERLLFIGMWNFADDEGLIRSHPSFLKANIFPYDDILKPEAIEKALTNFESKSLIYRYVINGQKYSWIVKFRVYQRIDKPQKPNNPIPGIHNSKFAMAVFKRDSFICHICGAETSIEDKLNNCNSRVPSLDHIKPTSKGGGNEPSNLLTACISCNKSKGNNVPIVFCEDSKNILGTIIDEEKLKEEKLKEEKLKEVEVEVEDKEEVEENSGKVPKLVPQKESILSQVDEEFKKFTLSKKGIDSFMSILASQNKTGLITESRKLSLLCQLSDVLAETGDETIFNSALLEMTGKGIANINYLKQVITSKKKGGNSGGTGSRQVAPGKTGEDSAEPDKYDGLGTVINLEG